MSKAITEKSQHGARANKKVSLSFQTLKENTFQRFLNSQPSPYQHGRGSVAACSGWGCFPVIDSPKKTRWLLTREMAAWRWAGLLLHSQRVTSMDLPCYVTWNALGGNMYRVSHTWGNTREKVALEMLPGTELGNSLHGRNSCKCSKSSLGREKVAIRAHRAPASQWCHFISQHCPLFSTDTYMQDSIPLAHLTTVFSKLFLNNYKPCQCRTRMKISTPVLLRCPLLLFQNPPSLSGLCWELKALEWRAKSCTGHGGCWVQRAPNITRPPSGPHHDTNPESKKSRGCCRQHYWFWHPGSPAHEHVLSWWQALPPESLTRRSTSIKQTSRLSAPIRRAAVGDGPTWHYASEDLWGRKASQSPPLALSRSLAPPGPRSLSGF